HQKGEKNMANVNLAEASELLEHLGLHVAPTGDANRFIRLLCTALKNHPEVKEGMHREVEPEHESTLVNMSLSYASECDGHVLAVLTNGKWGKREPTRPKEGPVDLSLFEDETDPEVVARLTGKAWPPME